MFALPFDTRDQSVAVVALTSKGDNLPIQIESHTFVKRVVQSELDVLPVNFANSTVFHVVVDRYGVACHREYSLTKQHLR